MKFTLLHSSLQFFVWDLMANINWIRTVYNLLHTINSTHLKHLSDPNPPSISYCAPPPCPTVDSKVLWYKVVRRRLRIGCYVRYLHIAPGCGQAGFFLIKQLRINRRNYKTNNSSFYLQDRQNWKWFEDCSTKGELLFRMFILYSQNKTIPQKNAAQVVQSYIIDILRSPNWSPVIKPFRTHLYFMSLSY